MSGDARDEHIHDRERGEEWGRRVRTAGTPGALAHPATNPGALAHPASPAGGGTDADTSAASTRALAPNGIEPGGVVKPTPPELFARHDTNRETRWEAMRGVGYLTPIELFFVRNHTSTPHVDPSTWRLRVHGSGVRRSLELTYDDLLAMPAVTAIRALECAGNGRRFFDLVQGRPAPGTPWGLGAIGVAEWTGVRLAEVLERAGLERGAVDVMPVGLDDRSVRRPLPVRKAVEDDTLLVYGMNGQVLPEDHGFPVRLLVPGWVGVANIKWVGSIEVADRPLFSEWNTTSYVMRGDGYPDRPAVEEQRVKSALELPWPARLTAGRHVLTGRSWSGQGAIREVEVSVDGGGSWSMARLGTPNVPKAWVQWSLAWDAPPGRHHVRVRAVDDRGNRQPDAVPHNEDGYLYWGAVDHPVTVT